MLLDLYRKPSSYRSVEIDPEYLALSHVDTVAEGIVTRKSVVKSISVSKDFAGFSVTDFDIATIVSTGSDKLLRPVQFRNTDVSSVASSLNNVIKMFEQNEEAV